MKKKLIKFTYLKDKLAKELAESMYKEIAELKSIIETGEISSAPYNRKPNIMKKQCIFCGYGENAGFRKGFYTPRFWIICCACVYQRWWLFPLRIFCQ